MSKSSDAGSFRSRQARDPEAAESGLIGGLDDLWLFSSFVSQRQPVRSDWGERASQHWGGKSDGSDDMDRLTQPALARPPARGIQP